jgi:hypothetical protein
LQARASSPSARPRHPPGRRERRPHYPYRPRPVRARRCSFYMSHTEVHLTPPCVGQLLSDYPPPWPMRGIQSPGNRQGGRAGAGHVHGEHHICHGDVSGEPTGRESGRNSRARHTGCGCRPPVSETAGQRLQRCEQTGLPQRRVCLPGSRRLSLDGIRRLPWALTT